MRFRFDFAASQILITCFEKQIHIEISSVECLLVREISLLKVLKVHEQCDQILVKMGKWAKTKSFLYSFPKCKKLNVYTFIPIHFCVKTV